MISRRTLRPVIQFLCWEAAFAMAYETWVGVGYLGGLAGELRISVFWMSVLAAVPSIGSSGQLLGTFLYVRFRSLRRYVLTLAMLARSLWVFPWGLALYWGARVYLRGGEFPTQLWFKVTLFCACCVSLLGSSSATGWMAWVQELVPEQMRGRFFGVRQRFVVGAMLIANVAASSLVSWMPSGFRLGYFILGTLALLSAGVSSFLLAQVPDRIGKVDGVKNRPGLRQESVAGGLDADSRTSVYHVSFREWRKWGGQWMEPFRHPRFRAVLLFGSFYFAAVMFVGPFFSYFFTRDLKLSMSEVALWAVCSNVACFIFSPYWGKRVDRMGSPIRVVFFCAALWALSPLPYAIPSVEWVRRLGPLEFFINGIAWSGYQIGMTSILTRVVPRESNLRAANYFSVYTFCLGVAGAIATLLGGKLAALLEPYGGFRTLWVLGSIVRFGVLAWGVLRLRLHFVLG